jgi:hypothetical protein
LDIPLQPANREDFPLFCCEHPIHFGDRLVGSFLHLLGRPFAVVLADLVVLFQFLEHVQAITPHVSHCHSGGLSIFVRNLDELLAALFVEFRDAQAQDLPFCGGG